MRRQTTAVDEFEQALTRKEQRLIAGLTSPIKIQAFLDTIVYSDEDLYRCPLRVLRDRKAHCFDGALFAAAALRRLGYPPLILDMIPDDRDDDHLLALYQRDGHWGAVAKSNFVGLRFREPVYRTLRELVMSFFEAYYNVAREKTLRGYTAPLNLATFDRAHWMTSDDRLDDIGERLGEIRQVSLLMPEMIEGLAPVDDRSYRAGLVGVNEAGLYRPPKQK
jgi:hypothetical protein